MTDKPKLPLPLPGDVDLSDLPFMPLQDQRLMKSRAWLLAKNFRGGGPGLGFCLLNLWVAGFRSVPAGSLDDDDDMLADAARCDIDFWLTIRDKAMRGWEAHGGRLWHPVICDLAWDLWLQRLAGRHLKALDSHRAAAKRATDKGVIPSDPPGSQFDWIAAKYPATAAYQAQLAAAQVETGAAARPADKTGSPLDNEPKRREGKEIPPFTPPASQAARPESGPGMQTAAEGKAWFGKELHRLENEFRPMLPVLLGQLQQPGIVGKFALVQTFKGSWIARAATGAPTIIMPTKRRADAVIAQHGEWIRHYWPDLVVRHARVEELRARKKAA